MQLHLRDETLVPGMTRLWGPPVDEICIFHATHRSRLEPPLTENFHMVMAPLSTLASHIGPLKKETCD